VHVDLRSARSDLCEQFRRTGLPSTFVPCMASRAFSAARRSNCRELGTMPGLDELAHVGDEYQTTLRDELEKFLDLAIARERLPEPLDVGIVLT